MKQLIHFIFLGFALFLIQCTPKGAEKTTVDESSVPNPSEQEFRKSAPAPSEPPEIKVGDFSSFTLDNGLKVIVVENHKRPTVSYSIRIDRDPIYEGDKASYVSIAGDMLRKGTDNRSKAEIDEAIDFIGGQLSTSAKGIYASSLKKHSDKLLDLMQDVLLHPTFPKDEFEKLKKQTKSAIASNMSDPNAISRNISNMVTYGKEHPYGEFATQETVESVSLNDVKNYYEKYFKPNISYLIIVGDVNITEAKKQAETYFSAWKKGDVPTHEYDMPQAPEMREVVFVDKPGAVQSVIKVTYPVNLTVGDDDIIAARVMNNVLGGGVFSGYLMQNLREDKGYTYGARSRLSSDEVVGEFQAYASVRHEVTDSSVVEFLRELNRIKNQKVDSTHLTLVKNSMTGSFARSLEDPQAIADQAFKIFKYNLPKDYYEKYLQRLNNITIEEVQDAAEEYIKPGNSYIVVVGNKDSVASTLKRFDADNEIDFYTPEGKKESSMKEALPVGLTADKVISDYIVAIGGRQNIIPINSIEWKATMNMMGRKFDAIRMVEEPNKYRQVMKMSGNVMQEVIYNDGKGMQKSMRGSGELPEDQLKEYAREAYIFKENHYDDFNAETKLDSYDKVDGVKVYEVKITYNSGKVQRDYYSVDTGLKVMESTTSRGPGERSITVNTKLQDYKEVNGVMFPHTIIIEGATPQPMRMTTKEININKEFEEGTFDISKE